MFRRRGRLGSAVDSFQLGAVALTQQRFPTNCAVRSVLYWEQPDLRVYPSPRKCCVMPENTVLLVFSIKSIPLKQISKYFVFE